MSAGVRGIRTSCLCAVDGEMPSSTSSARTCAWSNARAAVSPGEQRRWLRHVGIAEQVNADRLPVHRDVLAGTEDPVMARLASDHEPVADVLKSPADSLDASQSPRVAHRATGP